MTDNTIGIMGAMPEEIDSIVSLLSKVSKHQVGGRTYYEGYLNNIKAIVVFSRWGKVAAAATATTLILKFKIKELIFSGVAGAVNPNLNIGDIVIGKRFFQHDMDARPLMKQFEIPLLNISYFESPKDKTALFQSTINELLDQQHLLKVIPQEDLQEFNIHNPQLYIGDIASGDKFFAKEEDKQQLLSLLPNVLCVEMEGAAVAQIAYEYQVPYSIIRTISDAADEQAKVNFPAFIQNISSQYSSEIIKLYFSRLLLS